MNIRTIFFLLVGSLLVSASGLLGQNSWQWQNPEPQGNNLQAVDAVNANLIFAVGGAGTLVRSTNSGGAWDVRQVYANSAVTLEAVNFPNPSTGWVAGQSGVLLTTSDGGTHWFQRTTPAPARTYRALASTGVNNAFAVGDGGTILHTVDGGLQWTPVTSNTGEDLYGISLPTSTIGYAVGNNGAIVKTSDGGNNWVPVSDPNTVRDYKSVYFLTQDIGWVAGVGGTLLSTTDGGATWTRKFSGTSSALSSITFTNANLGFAVGGRAFIYTTNGGFSWLPYPTVLDTVNSLTAIAFADSNTGWIVGQNGEIKKTQNKGQAWTRFANNTGFDLFGSSFINESRGWVVGEAGTVMHTGDGGLSWFRDPTPVSATLRSVEFRVPALGWAVGDGGTVLRSLDGVTWNQVAIDSPQALYSVNFSDDNNGWAVGERGTILHSTDAGVSWQHAARPRTDTLLTLSSVYFTNPSTGWILANYGLSNDTTFILRTIDGGANWDTVHTENRTLLAMQFLGPDTGYVVGKFHYVAKTTNGGASWRPLINPVRSIQHFLALSFLNTTVGYVVGTGGNIIRTLSGGDSWSLEPSGTNRTLNAISFASADKGWTAGVGGAILNTIDGGGVEPPPEPPPPSGGGPADHVYQGEPNPFLPSINGVVFLPFRLAGQSEVKIRIFDVLGRLVRSIDAGVFGPGLHDMSSGAPSWNGVDEQGVAVPSGAYYFMVFTSEYIETQRLVLLR